MIRDRTYRIFAVALVVLLTTGVVLPQWALFLITIAFGKGLVVLGLLLLLRTGLVSFGQGLYYCLGAYAAGVVGQRFGMSDAVPMLLVGAMIAALIGAVLGFLLAKYRNIFFAMLTLAFSMILYGLLVKTSAFGSSDGFNIAAATVFGIPLHGRFQHYLLFALASVSAFAGACALHAYLKSPLGALAPAIRDNELRVEYMGASARNAVHVKYVIAAALGGLGGALTAIAVGHIDPEMAYWTTSGEFVFVTILSGSGSVIAPFVGAFLFEAVRSFAYQYSPNTWQLVLGTAMLLLIVLLPAGLWSLFRLGRKGA